MKNSGANAYFGAFSAGLGGHELLDGARELDRRIDALRQTAAMLLREMSPIEAGARRLGGGWTAEALGWLADGGRRDRRR